ncbi:MAG: alpha/beta fold hydrolase [Anaerolineales bacterium]|nr:alpha/beta fold hydrolase [Anaerolineales bacterium]MCB9112844.1 alpha/beta fold hydrolase [Anaerolineales bacterium]
MPKTQSNGIELYYESHGEGKPLVLISGLGYPHWQWHKMVPVLAEHFQVITFDNRGVGQSDKPAGPYTAQMLAQDTVGLLDALGIEKAIIVGHSMGGFIAQAMALDFPQRVEKLILCSTNFGGPHHVPVTPEAMKVLSDVTSDPLTRFKNGLVVSTAPGWADKNPEMIEEWIKWRVANPIEPAPYQAQLAIGLSLLPEAAAFEDKLQRLDVPTLILFGAHDKVVPPANADLLSKKISGSTVMIFPDAGHFFPIEIAEAASRAITDFAA